jgi:hypothetical protein
MSLAFACGTTLAAADRHASLLARGHACGTV